MTDVVIKMHSWTQRQIHSKGTQHEDTEKALPTRQGMSQAVGAERERQEQIVPRSQYYEHIFPSETIRYTFMLLTHSSLWYSVIAVTTSWISTCQYILLYRKTNKQTTQSTENVLSFFILTCLEKPFSILTWSEKNIFVQIELLYRLFGIYLNLENNVRSIRNSYKIPLFMKHYIVLYSEHHDN